MSASGMAAQLQTIKGPWLRLLWACSARTTSSLPVPLGPLTSAVRKCGPMRRTRSKMLRIATLRPTMPSNENRSEEHTSELQSLRHLVCRLLLEKNHIERSLALRNPSDHPYLRHPLARDRQ